MRALKQTEGLFLFPEESPEGWSAGIREASPLTPEVKGESEEQGGKSTETPLVSVIIPTYNRAYCLSSTLESVLAQTWSRLEVLVVDDGSTDETRGLIEGIASIDSRVRYISQENGGVSAARNTGIRNVRGDYVAMLDSDDLWLPWKLEAQVGILERFPELGLVWTEMEAIDPEGRVTHGRYLRRMYSGYEFWKIKRLFPFAFPLNEIVPSVPAEVVQGPVLIGDIFSEMVGGNLVHTSTVMIRRELVERVGFYNSELRGIGEDFDYHLRLCRLAPVALIDIPSIQYRRGLTDHLGCERNKLHAAMNYLRVIAPVLRDERGRLELSDEEILGILQEGCNWAGEMAINAGLRRAGREFLRLSLTYDPWQARTRLVYLLAHLPRSADALLRYGAQWVKLVMLRDEEEDLARLASEILSREILAREIPEPGIGGEKDRPPRDD